MKKIFSVFALVLGFSVAASAADTPAVTGITEIAPFEIAVGLGGARHSGYLSEDTRRGALDLAFRFHNPSERGYLEIFIAGTQADPRTDYGFNADDKLKIGITGIGPTMMFNACSHLKLGLGVGYANIQVAQGDENLRSFGAFYWAGQVQYQFTPKWQAFYTTRWMAVRETYNNQDTFFELWLNTIGAAYKF
jgi:hypothetical protein